MLFFTISKHDHPHHNYSVVSDHFLFIVTPLSIDRVIDTTGKTPSLQPVKNTDPEQHALELPFSRFSGTPRTVTYRPFFFFFLHTPPFGKSLLLHPAEKLIFLSCHRVPCQAFRTLSSWQYIYIYAWHSG